MDDRDLLFIVIIGFYIILSIEIKRVHARQELLEKRIADLEK